MKLIVLIIIGLLFFFCLGCILGILVTRHDFDLPEELEAISKDKNHPDTMIVYYGDKYVLHLEFYKKGISKTF